MLLHTDAKPRVRQWGGGLVRGTPVAPSNCGPNHRKLFEMCLLNLCISAGSRWLLQAHSITVCYNMGDYPDIRGLPRLVAALADLTSGLEISDGDEPPWLRIWVYTCNFAELSQKAVYFVCEQWGVDCSLWRVLFSVHAADILICDWFWCQTICCLDSAVGDLEKFPLHSLWSQEVDYSVVLIVATVLLPRCWVGFYSVFCLWISILTRKRSRASYKFFPPCLRYVFAAFILHAVLTSAQYCSQHYSADLWRIIK